MKTKQFKFICKSEGKGLVYEKDHSRLIVYSTKFRYWSNKFKADSIDRSI